MWICFGLRDSEYLGHRLTIAEEGERCVKFNYSATDFMCLAFLLIRHGFGKSQSLLRFIDIIYYVVSISD